MRPALTLAALLCAASLFAAPQDPKAEPTGESKAIFDELAVPAIDGSGDAALRKLPFAADALKGYEADVSVAEVRKNKDRYPLRVAVLDTLDTSRRAGERAATTARRFGSLTAPITDQTKRDVSKAQDALALVIADLELQLAVLEAGREQRAKEPKRWQAHYDYVSAEGRLRLVALNELNRALGNVRTEALPDLPAGSPGYRLVPSEKLFSGAVSKELYAAAVEGFKGVAAAHKGTPWAALAERNQALAPSLRWEALAPKPADK